MTNRAPAYELIREPTALAKFIEWLPDLGPHEKYLVCLHSRKKYAPDMKRSDKESLKRFTATKRNLFLKIHQLESPQGSYKAADGTAVPLESLAVYITPNPRCMKAAAFATIRELASDLQSRTGDLKYHLNPHATALTCIHRSKSRSCFVHFDVDLPTGDEAKDACATKTGLTPAQLYESIVRLVSREAVTAIRTRGGMHFLVQPEKVVSITKNWHPLICKTLGVDQTGDLMLPVPGCCQGDFVPYFYTPETDHAG